MARLTSAIRRHTTASSPVAIGKFYQRSDNSHRHIAARWTDVQWGSLAPLT